MTDLRIGVTRRDLLRLTIGGGAGLAVGGLVEWPAAAAAAQAMKVSNVQEFTTSCNFCACGCGMIASVRDGLLSSMEGDFDQGGMRREHRNTFDAQRPAVHDAMAFLGGALPRRSSCLASRRGRKVRRHLRRLE